MLSKITLIGMNNFSEGHLFDNLNLPEGIDKDILINEIMKRGGEFSLLYPDLEFMKYQIGAWGIKWAKTFERWLAANNFEYEALWNLDVTYTRTEEGYNSASGSKTTSENTSGTNSETTSGNTSETNSETTSGASDGASTNEHSKAAYDSGTYQKTEKDQGENHVTSSGSKSVTLSGNSSGSKSVTLSGTSSGSESTTDNSNHTITITESRNGNQGVTMSQELLDAERNVWMWNLYSHMADLFINEYCICVYL